MGCIIMFKNYKFEATTGMEYYLESMEKHVVNLVLFLYDIEKRKNPY